MTYYDAIMEAAHDVGVYEELIASPADPNTVNTAVEMLAATLYKACVIADRPIPRCWVGGIMSYAVALVMANGKPDTA
ncbi:hypothetical protein FACS1894184_14010 [Clostridia bacterium]|nr:hypothetical protein FACS1894184_14010 [Clostridia bacterium]